MGLAETTTSIASFRLYLLPLYSRVLFRARHFREITSLALDLSLSGLVIWSRSSGRLPGAGFSSFHHRMRSNEYSFSGFIPTNKHFQFSIKTLLSNKQTSSPPPTMGWQMEANHDCTILCYQKSMLSRPGGRNDQILRYLHSNSNRRRPLLGLTVMVIHEHREEGAIFLKKVLHVETCCYSWSELISDNGEIDLRTRPYQPEAFGPSGPGWVFCWAGYQESFCFPPFLLGLHPLPLT